MMNAQNKFLTEVLASRSYSNRYLSLKLECIIIWTYVKVKAILKHFKHFVLNYSTEIKLK